MGSGAGMAVIALRAAGWLLGLMMLVAPGRAAEAPPPATTPPEATVTVFNRDIVVLRSIVARHGRAEVEQVMSGLGLRNLHRALHTGICAAGIKPVDEGIAAALTRAALERRCASCDSASAPRPAPPVAVLYG